MDDGLDEPLLFGIDREERIIPLSSKSEWDLWMDEKGKKLRCLLKVGTEISVGVKFLGEQAGWGKTRSPLLWQAAVLVHKRAIATVHAETFDEAMDMIDTGLRKVLKEKPPWGRGSSSESCSSNSGGNVGG